MRYLIISFLLLSMGFFAFPALSQPHTGYCDKAKSTADTMACVNRHNEDAQERLNAAYKALEAQLGEAGKTKLGEAGKAWIAYRNAQCLWEASRAKAPGLERIYELSCLASLTENRTALLDAAIKEETADTAPREFSSTPRWVNVLAEENPQVFWRYGQSVSADFDCDGTDEYAVAGITLSEMPKTAEAGAPTPKEGQAPATQQNLPPAYSAEIKLALIENPLTGRPKAEIFTIPVKKQDSELSLCSANPAVSITVHPAKATAKKPATPKAGTDNTENAQAVHPSPAPAAEAGRLEPASGPACQTALQITAASCAPLLLYQDLAAKAYVIKQQSTAPVP